MPAWATLPPAPEIGQMIVRSVTAVLISGRGTLVEFYSLVHCNPDTFSTLFRQLINLVIRLVIFSG
jgi:hypothetical protein